MPLPRLSRRDAIVVLTGAGISRESGLDTFRDKDGVWARVRLEDVATPEGFERDPSQVHDFYNARRAQLHDPEISPNPAHRALAELEQSWEGPFLLVTQNVDNLHDRAGSQAMIHMHGELASRLCAACETRVPWTEPLDTAMTCPDCGETGVLRPDIVWFGEMPYQMEEIYAALGGCDLFVSIGTSGTVYPAAQFVAEARHQGAWCVELNLEPSRGASLFHEVRQGPASELVPAFVAEILQATG